MKTSTLIFIGALLISAFIISIGAIKIYNIHTNNISRVQFSGKFNTILRSEIPNAIRLKLDHYCSKPEECDTSNLPKSFDSRDKWGDLITKPLNQQQCGSCWAFATTTCISDRIRINSYVGKHSLKFMGDNQNPSSLIGWKEQVISKSSSKPLSRKLWYRRGEFEAIDNISPFTFAGCDVCEIAHIIDSAVYKYLKETNNSCNECCDGGIIQYAFIYAMVRGCLSVADDPDPWSYDCSNWVGAPEYKVKNVYHLSGGIEQIKANIFHFGPVVSGINVLTSFGYDSGKIPGTDVFGNYGTVRGGHAIVIVGWGSQKAGNGNTVEYWLCRNSWGSEWNGDGFFKMQMGICGIEDDVWGAKPFDVYDLTRTKPRPRPAYPKNCDANK